MIFSLPTLWPVRYFPPWEKRSPLRLKFMDNHRVTPVPELAIKVPLHRWFLGEYGTMYGIRMYRCIYIYTFPFVTIFFCIMIVYMLDTLIVWYDLCLPTLALSSPPQKKNIVTVRESGNHRPVISTLNPYGPGGLVTTGPLWRVHGDVWKVRGQRVFGKPRFCSRKNPGNCGK